MNDEDKNALIDRATKWVENPPASADEYDIEDVQRLLNRPNLSDRGLKSLAQLIKGNRTTIELTKDDMVQVTTITQQLEDIFQQLPELAVPREKNREKFEAAVTKAVKATKRDA